MAEHGAQSPTDLPTDLATIVLDVRVVPNARKNVVERVGHKALRVKVSAKAIDGLANNSVIAAIAAALDIRPKNVTLWSGAKSRLKRVAILGSNPETILRMIDSLPAGAIIGAVPTPKRGSE